MASVPQREQLASRPEPPLPREKGTEPYVRLLDREVTVGSERENECPGTHCSLIKQKKAVPARNIEIKGKTEKTRRRGQNESQKEEMRNGRLKAVGKYARAAFAKK